MLCCWLRGRTDGRMRIRMTWRESWCDCSRIAGCFLSDVQLESKFCQWQQLSFIFTGVSRSSHGAGLSLVLETCENHTRRLVKCGSKG
jgi:hypothetical protein